MTAQGPRAEISTGPSRRLASGLVAMLLAGVVPALVFLPWLVCLPALLLLTGLAGRAYRLHVARTHPQAITAVRPDAAGLSVRFGSGDWAPVRVLPGALVTPWLTVARLAVDGRWAAAVLVLLPDSVDPDAYRRLRVFLRWGYQERAEGTDS